MANKTSFGGYYENIGADHAGNPCMNAVTFKRDYAFSSNLV